MEVKISDWQLICELERRIESKTIFRSRNGKLYPRFCPACGGTLTEYGVEINLRPHELELLDFKTWTKMSKDLTDKEALYLPTLPFRETGKFYLVRCDNYYYDTSPCPVQNYEWFKDLDAARDDFFNSAMEYDSGIN